MLFDLYVNVSGWLQRLDPRAKILLVATGAILFISAWGVASLLFLLSALHFGLWTSRVPWSRPVWVFNQLRPVLVVILLLYPWMAAAPGRVLLEAGPFIVTDSGILLALATALRLWGMSLLVLALQFTTTQPELVRGLVAMGMPYDWGLTLSIALRYIPSLALHVEQIQEAQRARGWDATSGDVLKRLRALSPVFVALTIYVFRTVDTLTMAMIARGVGASTTRTARRPLHFAARDWIAVMTAVAVVVIWFAMRAFRV